MLRRTAGTFLMLSTLLAPAGAAPAASGSAAGDEAASPASLVGGFDTASRVATLVLIGGALVVLETSGTETIEEIGDVLQIGLPVAALGATYLARDGRGRRDFLKSIGTSTLTVLLLKQVVEKARPNAQGLNSFPSGHTAAAFSGASFLNLRYGARWGVPAMVLAGYTGASRIYADKHFLDDVISGLSISLLANRYHVFPLETRFDLAPLTGDGAIGLAARWRGSARRWHETADDPAAEPERGLRYEWEFGSADVGGNDVATPSAGGDTLSFLFDERNNPTVTARVELGYTRRGRRELALQVAPFEVRDFGTLAADTSFAGSIVPAGEPLRSRYLLYDYRVRARHLMRPHRRVEVRAGAGLSFQDVVANLSWPGGEAEIEEGNWIPFVHLDAELSVGGRLRVALQADAGRSAEDRLQDTAVELRYRLHPRWDLNAGVRRVERTIVTRRLRNEQRRDQLVIALGYRF